MISDAIFPAVRYVWKQNRFTMTLRIFGEKKVVSDSWEVISTYIKWPLQRSPKGNRLHAITTDYYSTLVVAKPLSDATAQAVTRHVEEDIFLKYGVPRLLLCENGKQNTSKLYTKMLENLNRKVIYNAYYHPQSNPTEGVNQVIKIIQSSKDLAKYICAIRTAVHEVTDKTLFFLNYEKCAYLEKNTN